MKEILRQTQGLQKQTFSSPNKPYDTKEDDEILGLGHAPTGANMVWFFILHVKA